MAKKEMKEGKLENIQKNAYEAVNVLVKEIIDYDYDIEKDVYTVYIKAEDNDKNSILLEGELMETPHSLIDMKLKVFGNFYYDEQRKVYIFAFFNYEIQPVDFIIFLKTVGIRKQAVEEIVGKYTYKEFTEILESGSVEELTAIKGIGKTSALKAIEKYKEYKNIKILNDNLSPFGFNLYDIQKIYNYFINEKNIEDFEELCFNIIINPYVLLDVPGIDFHRIDELAINEIGQIKSDSPIRIKEGIKYALKKAKDSSGNTIINKKILFKYSYNILETDKFTLNEKMFNEGLAKAIEEKNIIEITSDSFIHYEDISTENEIYNIVMEGLNKNIEYPFLLTKEKSIEEIKKFEKYEKIKYSKEQNEALIKILTSNKPVFFINGYAGTGKTTVIKGAVRILLRNRKILPNEIMVCALAGTAANRAKNVIELPYSKTIHSMLGIIDDPKTGKPLLKYGEKNKLPYKLIIVDESAMMDNFLFLSLLKAVDFEKTKIVFIGDIAQLPPVGNGAPFEEFVSSHITADIKVSFNKIFRQKDGMLIETANNIRIGHINSFFNDKQFNSKDFYYKQYGSDNKNEIKKDIEEHISKNIKNYIENIENKEYEKAISDFQILSPQKQNFMGVYHLNRIVQRTVHKMINPEKDIYFLLSYYIIDFLNVSENKKYSSLLKIKGIIEKIKESGYSSNTEAKIYEKILKEIQKAEKRKIFYHFEKYIRENSHYLFNFYGFYYGNKYIYKEKDKVIHLQNGDYITFNLNTYFFLRDSFITGEINKYNLKKHKLTKDQYKKQRIYNGQIGIVDAIINSLGIFVIYPFENYVVLYNGIDENILNPAYSISIHKSQGQEYQKVYIPIIDRHMFMLNNKALYTAITRGKTKAYIFAQKYTVPKIISKKDSGKRNTYLGQLLQ